MFPRIIPSVFMILLLSSCATSQESGIITATVSSPTSTLSSSPTSASTETPLPPPSQPTTAPVEGTTSTQINVRAEPSTASNILGMIPANTKVQIIGKDPAGNWLQIFYAQGVDGKGWVTAQYVLTANSSLIPVIGGGETNPSNGNIAIVQQQINVRSGPGTGFNSLGTLNPKDVVNLIGKDAHGTWLQIEFASGLDGKGWINTAFVQAQGVENVPIITEAGQIIGTGTPTIIPATPTLTVQPAWMDNDSQDNPIASVVFEPLGIYMFIYSGDISAPTGDAQDWIQFIPDTNHVYVSLQCNDKNLNVRILENGQSSALHLACNDTQKELRVKEKSIYLILLQAPPFSGRIQYSQYTVTITEGK